MWIGPVAKCKVLGAISSILFSEEIRDRVIVARCVLKGLAMGLRNDQTS